jgi:hypothetical protein
MTSTETTEAPKPTNVVGALARVMAEIPGIGKDSQAAAQQGGYKYRGIEAITIHVQPLLAKYGVVFVPRVASTEVVDIEVNGKPWTDTRLLVDYTIYGPGGIDDHIPGPCIYALGRDNSDKGANKAMTQAFKYAMLQVLCISDAKDDADGATHEADNPPPRQAAAPTNGHRSAAPPPAQEDDMADRISDSQKKYFEKLCADLHYDRHGICNEILGVNIGSIVDLSKAQASRVINEMVKRKEAMT